MSWGLVVYMTNFTRRGVQYPRWGIRVIILSSRTKIYVVDN